MINSNGLLVGEDADLPKSIIKHSPIEIFLYIVNWPSFKDSSSFYTQMRKSIIDAPTTSQPSAKTFKELFTDNLKKYQDIIVITISESFSGTYNSANQAKKILSEKDQKRIHIIDSESSSGSEALLTLKALQLISKELEVDIILRRLKKIIPTLHLIGVFDDPKWLQKGGRINAVQAMLVKNMLKVGFRPILTIRDGQIVTKKIQVNAKDKTGALFSQFKEEVAIYNGLSKQITVVITHSDCKKEAILLKKMIENYSQAITIKFINTISPVIGAHLGYDALLLSWMVES